MRTPGRPWVRLGKFVGLAAILLPFWLLCQPLPGLAADEDLAQETPPPSDEATEIATLESDYVFLLKEIKRSPQEDDLKKKAEKEKNQLYEANYRMGRKLEKEGYLLAAVDSYQRALLYDPTSDSARKALLRAQQNLTGLNQKQSDEAYQEGMQLYLAGDQKSAADDWKRALELNSQNTDAQNALEKVSPPQTPAPDSGESPKNVDHPSEEDIPEDSDTRESMWDQDFRQGIDHETVGEYQEAEESFKKALKYMPGDASTKKELAKVEAVLNEKHGQNSQDSYLLAIHSLQNQDYRSAYEYLNDSIAADSSNDQARALLEKLVKQRPELLAPASPSHAPGE